MSASCGQLVLVVGPSGAGKDTLIDFAKGVLQGDSAFRFTKRIITRPASAGEDHIPATQAEFHSMLANGELSLSWEAHGLSYGLPASVRRWLEEGALVVVNGSRAAVASARIHYPTLQTINITASPEILAKRLASRGREDKRSIELRLARAMSLFENASFQIDNSGPLETGGGELVRALKTIRSRTKL